MPGPSDPRPLDPAFLAGISYVQAALEFRADGDVHMPPFAGSTLRGVLGHALRRRLCALRPPCADDCAHPAGCTYFSLFERDRPAPGLGANLPKPMILEPPVAEALTRAAEGGPVLPPLRLTAQPGALPILENEAPNVLAAGGCVTVRLTLLGQADSLFLPVIDVLAVSPLPIGAGRLMLSRATDTFSGAVLFDRKQPAFSVQMPATRTLAPLLELPRTEVRALEVCFLTPVRLRAGNGYCFDAERLSTHFWEAALTRAIRVRDSLCRPGEDRVPWMDLPATLPRLTCHRLYQYAFRRMSHRQRRFMDFDGMVGNLRLEGDFGGLLPLARAAEILHIGQKATFGLGQVRCRVVD